MTVNRWIPVKTMWIILASVLTIVGGLVGCGLHHGEGEMAARDGVFVHISHGADDPHRVLMGLRMAELMADDRDVLVYFDITGVEVVLKEAPDLAYAEFPSSNGQLQKLQSMNVSLYVCPGCLKAAGKTTEDVREGVAIAEKDAFFKFTKGRILTLDY